MKKIIFVLLTCLTAVTGWAGEPPKVLGIAFVRIKVTTEDSGGGFYHGTLRLPLMKSGCFGPDAECLFLRPSQQIDIIKMSGSSTGKQIDSFGFFTSDAIGLRRCLSAKGLKPGKLKTDLPFEISFPIKDPESHRVVFVQLTSGFAGSVSGGPPIASRIIHAGFVVRDRAAMDKFYKDVLGFHVYWHGGMKEGETNWVDMQVPDGTDWIEYMLNVPADADKRTLGVMNHIALGVPDVREAANQLEKAGVKLTEQPKIGKDGKWQLNLYDPDQTRVELMEFTPVEKPCCAEYTGPHPKP